ncbi:unnamed protein product, partial [Meganyctiphanes norvegica]
FFSFIRDKFLDGSPFSTYQPRFLSDQNWEERWSAWWLPVLITNGRVSAPPIYIKEIRILQQQLRREMLTGENTKFGQAYLNLKHALSKSFDSETIKKLSKKHQNSSISFDEFINHVLWSYKFSVVDHHWVPFSVLCDVCEAKYDYILQLERASEEVPYVLRKMGYNVSRFENTHNSGKINKAYSYKLYFNKLSRIK